MTKNVTTSGKKTFPLPRWWRWLYGYMLAPLAGFILLCVVVVLFQSPIHELRLVLAPVIGLLATVVFVVYWAIGLFFTMVTSILFQKIKGWNGFILHVGIGLFFGIPSGALLWALLPLERREFFKHDQGILLLQVAGLSVVTGIVFRALVYGVSSYPKKKRKGTKEANKKESPPKKER